jgi:hypothetical protein
MDAHSSPKLPLGGKERLMFRSRWVVGIVSCSMSLALLAGLGRAQEEKKSASKAAGKDEVKGRLPLYFGQIGLSGKQEDEVRKVAQPFDERIAKVKKQIAELEKQIDDIDAEKLIACEKLLSDGQKSALKARREQAATERAAKSKKTGDGDSKKEEKK